MLELLLGADDFSKKQYLKKTFQPGSLAEFFGADNCPSLEELTAQDLFGAPKAFVLENCLGVLALAETASSLAALAGSPHQIFLLEEKLDRRKKDNLRLLDHPQVKVKIFELPQGEKLKSWVAEQAKNLGIKIQPGATTLLLTNLGINTDARPNTWAAESAFSLHQVYNELLKLGTFADGEEIGEVAVAEMVFPSAEVAIWDILNAVADKKAQAAFGLLERFYERGPATEEKEKTIQLNAALAEQFRNLLAVRDFLGRRVPDSQILEKTGWKSGRLYVLKRLASRFSDKILRQTLAKLASLDLELKTSPAPARVLLEFIAAQVI